jgi:hypothetical protein
MYSVLLLLAVFFRANPRSTILIPFFFEVFRLTSRQDDYSTARLYMGGTGMGRVVGYWPFREGTAQLL